MKESTQPPTNSTNVQVSISSLTLGTLYEAVLGFSSQDRFETLWPSVCQNARWLIPYRRMAILLSGMEERFRIVGMFGQGKFQQPVDHVQFTPKNDSLKRALSKRNVHWIPKPWEQFGDETGEFTRWLLYDQPDMLFVLPMRMKEKPIGTLLFAMTSVADSDQAMLNTLGTTYALHVGMTYTLLQITEDRRQMESQLVMQERMAALGSLVAGVAHEINNPVGAIQSATDVVVRCAKTLESLGNRDGALQGIHEDQQDQKTFKILKQNAEVIAAASDRIAKIVRSLKNFARLDEAEYAKASIQEGIDSTLTLLDNELVGRITVIRDYDEIPKIYCFPGQLNQVFMSLLQNASEAIEGPGTIRIKTCRRDNFIDIQISDSGRGIPPERLKRIFHFDFSKTGSRVRMGSGLAAAYNIIQRHKGEIKAESKLGEGSCFTIILPISAEAVRQRHH